MTFGSRFRLKALGLIAVLSEGGLSRIHAVLLLWAVVESVLDTGHTVLATRDLTAAHFKLARFCLGVYT